MFRCDGKDCGFESPSEEEVNQHVLDEAKGKEIDEIVCWGYFDLSHSGHAWMPSDIRPPSHILHRADDDDV